MRIRTAPRELPDKSQVFDVVLSKDGVTIRVEAYTKDDAEQLRTVIADAIDYHSTEKVRK